jgi:hypothetical protein
LKPCVYFISYSLYQECWLGENFFKKKKMERIYIPYINEKPLTISVKGHRILIVTEDVLSIESLLPTLENFRRSIDSANIYPISSAKKRSLKKTKASLQFKDLECDTEEDKALLVERIASSESAHVVFAPEGESLNSIIDYIETSLPWIH